MRISRPLLGLACLLSGCSTVDQVPLVYVSAVKVGVNVASGTASSPGASIVIGVDATDAAFVPVSVARTCKVVAWADCNRRDYPIEQIRGDNSISAAEAFAVAQQSARALVQSQDMYRQALADLKAAQRAENVADIATTQKQDAERQRAEARQERADIGSAIALAPPPADKATVPGTSGTVTPTILSGLDKRIAQLDSRIVQLTPEADKLDSARRQTATVEQRVTELDQIVNDNRRELEKLLSKSPSSNGLRNDALSVYGSFNTDINAAVGPDSVEKKQNVGLNLGKSFSTGVAAQLLAEGLARTSSSTAAAACIRSAEKLSEMKDSGGKSLGTSEIILAAIKACTIEDR